MTGARRGEERPVPGRTCLRPWIAFPQHDSDAAGFGRKQWRKRGRLCGGRRAQSPHMFCDHRSRYHCKPRGRRPERRVGVAPLKRDDALWRPVPSAGARVGTRRQRTWWPPHPREAGHVPVTDLAMPGPGRPCGDTRRAVAPPWAASGAADGAATGERHFHFMHAAGPRDGLPGHAAELTRPPQLGEKKAPGACCRIRSRNGFVSFAQHFFVDLGDSSGFTSCHPPTRTDQWLTTSANRSDARRRCCQPT